MTTDLPSLWLDWCAVTGVEADHVDEATLARFALQAHPSAAVLRVLRVQSGPAQTLPAPAWPAELRDDVTSLSRLLRSGHNVLAYGDQHWISRLRVIRMLFTAVLVAPPATEAGVAPDTGARPDAS